MKIVVTLLAALFFLLPVLNFASSLGGGKGYESGLFFGADLNRDLRLDQDEAKGVYNLSEDEIFARYDEDESGYITQIEFREYLQQTPWVDKFVHPKDRK